MSIPEAPYGRVKGMLKQESWLRKDFLHTDASNMIYNGGHNSWFLGNSKNSN